MNLFKKNQIGGTIEICVKHVGQDLIQLPRNSKQVFVRVVARRKTGGNSSDTSHWCQKVVMKRFIIMISQFLPTDVLCTSTCILKLVTKKKLDLPYDMVTNSPK